MFQRIESAAIFIAATVVYFHNDFNWLLYILLLFAFDVFMMGYLANPRVGAILYNLGHSFIFPAILGAIYAYNESDVVLGLTCLWLAHIGIDRALGYGLKLPTHFRHTHLGDIGSK